VHDLAGEAALRVGGHLDLGGLADGDDGQVALGHVHQHRQAAHVGDHEERLVGVGADFHGRVDVAGGDHAGDRRAQQVALAAGAIGRAAGGEVGQAQAGALGFGLGLLPFGLGGFELAAGHDFGGEQAAAALEGGFFLSWASAWALARSAAAVPSSGASSTASTAPALTVSPMLARISTTRPGIGREQAGGGVFVVGDAGGQRFVHRHRGQLGALDLELGELRGGGGKAQHAGLGGGLLDHGFGRRLRAGGAEVPGAAGDGGAAMRAMTMGLRFMGCLRPGAA
jgi:hypothetical protein